MQALAARFAAKEACFKALGAGVLEGALHQVEIVSADGGAPQLRLTGALARRARERGVAHAYVSLTHEPGLAAAVVILEGASPRRRATKTWALETVSSGTW
jgi:holo-[acyl-carrier protein] synthase